MKEAFYLIVVMGVRNNMVKKSSPFVRTKANEGVSTRQTSNHRGKSMVLLCINSNIGFESQGCKKFPSHIILQHLIDSGNEGKDSRVSLFRKYGKPYLRIPLFQGSDGWRQQYRITDTARTNKENRMG